MTREEWLIQYNLYICDNFQDIDPDLIAELGIVERYLTYKGQLPQDTSTYHAISQAIAFYSTVLVPLLGEFPE